MLRLLPNGANLCGNAGVPTNMGEIVHGNQLAILQASCNIFYVETTLLALWSMLIAAVGRMSDQRRSTTSGKKTAQTLIFELSPPSCHTECYRCSNASRMRTRMLTSSVHIELSSEGIIGYPQLGLLTQGIRPLCLVSCPHSLVAIP